MQTKLVAAELATAAGVSTVIMKVRVRRTPAAGRSGWDVSQGGPGQRGCLAHPDRRQSDKLEDIARIMAGEPLGTVFRAQSKTLGDRKW